MCVWYHTDFYTGVLFTLLHINLLNLTGPLIWDLKIRNLDQAEGNEKSDRYRFHLFAQTNMWIN